MSFIDKILGDPGDKHIKKKLNPLVHEINALEKEFQSKSDDQLKAVTEELRSELKNGNTLELVLPRAFAVVREAAKRALGMRHFDVQLIGGMVLNQGDIAEMRTGEGKTLVATLATYLNALEGKGSHVVTVNDYLARRDAVWMAQVYDFLGLSVGVIQHEKSYLYDSSIKTDESRHAELDSASDSDDGKKQTLKQVQGDDSNDDERASPMIEIDYDHLRPVSRKEAYSADITYGTNNEFGFDYLRDNMVIKTEQMVQRPFNFAIVDEVDSILIDEARTPLIISAPDNRPIDLYYKYANLVKELKENEDYNIDEKMRSSTLTESGVKKMEQWLGVENIYTDAGLDSVHHIEQALKANTLFEKDKDYVVQENEIIIVDEFTGRLMQGRRYSEGLHQAIEAKEGVEIKRESRTLATITFQNYFRLYPKLAGMTGTAKTEEEEFRRIYNLDVYVIPTNKPIARLDHQDRVYKSSKGKYQALVKEIKKRQDKGQPVLVGTISIEQNEEFSEILQKAGLRHEILNAKNHEREAEIIAQAGSKGSVTLATNMAGRGVDIVLGGAPFEKARAEEVKKLGGLHVLGTERHEARRIDNQLRGRSGRQGDPGSSQFFISVEDDLMRIFGSDRIKNMMNRLGVPEDMPIENKMVSRAIESAQKKVEGNNFDIRKHVVQYDDVMNMHRESIYKQRRAVLEFFPLARGGDEDGAGDHYKDENKLRKMIFEMIEHEIQQVVNLHTSPTNCEEWNLEEIEQTMATIFPLNSRPARGGDQSGAGNLNLKDVICPEGDKDKGKDAQMRSKLIDHLVERAKDMYAKMSETLGSEEEIKDLERAVLLNSIDTLWMDHLEALDNLRTAVGLRGYGQRDPLVEYKRDAYGLFQQLQGAIQNQVVYSVFKIMAARSMQARGAGNLLQALGGGLSQLQGMRFSAPAKEGKERGESPFMQSAQAGGAPVSANASSTSATQLMQNAATASSSIAQSPRNRFDGEKVGRNDPCPCGSGKKFKKCHGK